MTTPTITSKTFDPKKNLDLVSISWKTPDADEKIKDFIKDGTGKYLSLRGCPINGETLIKILQMTSLIALSLEGCWLTGWDFKIIGQAGKNLQGLVLDGNRDIGDFMSHITNNLSKLKYLSINGCKMENDVFIKIAQNLPELITLRANNNSCEESGARELSKMKSLNHLSLRNNCVGNAGAADLLTKHGLLEIDLDNNSITVELKVKLSETIRKVVLSYNRLGDDFMAALPESNVVDLDASYTGIGNSAMSWLGKMPFLTQLTLSGNKIDDDGLRELMSSRTLRSLWMYSCSLTDESVDYFLQRGKFHFLVVSGNGLTEKGGKRLQYMFGENVHF